MTCNTDEWGHQVQADPDLPAISTNTGSMVWFCVYVKHMHAFTSYAVVINFGLQSKPII